MLKVFGRQFHPGEKSYFTLDGPTLCNRASVKLPVIVLCGGAEGPTLWLNGAVHGDEINGSYASWQLIRDLNPREVRGNVIATPVANLAAFLDQRKVSFLDDLDMDTQFPGDAEGMITQRLAKIIYDGVREAATHLISFHTISKMYDAHPYTVAKLVPDADATVNRTAVELAKAFGVQANCIVNLSDASGELPGVTSGALDITCIKDGIPAFMGEIGHGGIADPAMIRIAVQGIKNVMKTLGMLDGSPVLQTSRQYKILRRKFVRIDDGGVLDMNVKPGDIVHKGDSLGELHYFNDRPVPYPAPCDAYVIAVRTYPAINTGDRVAFLGLKWEDYCN
ncbi:MULTISPECIES: M14 family metallopeptidase [Acutalibacteraceae]|uniref:M14 family metallopeptidase n=1 Tax=Acutalibacteraceae TaxID=3082771 RepID=UPI0013E8A945|nr:MULTISPECIES: M14 family metallopeptidase [Acutalibacteraceae]